MAITANGWAVLDAAVLVGIFVVRSAYGITWARFVILNERAPFAFLVAQIIRAGPTVTTARRPTSRVAGTLSIAGFSSDAEEGSFAESIVGFREVLALVQILVAGHGGAGVVVLYTVSSAALGIACTLAVTSLTIDAEEGPFTVSSRFSVLGDTHARFHVATTYEAGGIDGTGRVVLLDALERRSVLVRIVIQV